MGKEVKMGWISECCDAEHDEFFSLNFHFPAMPSGLCGSCREHTSFNKEREEKNDTKRLRKKQGLLLPVL